MATKTFDELKQLAIQIRDEKTNKQNTANRVGAAMLESINKLEQDYYDKTNIDEQSKNTTQSITSLDTKIDKRTTEYNVSVNNPTGGTNGDNKYDLASAIGKVPAELRSSGLTVSFLNESGDTEKWEFGGSSWAVGGFSQVGAGKLTELSDNVVTQKKEIESQNQIIGIINNDAIYLILKLFEKAIFTEDVSANISSLNKALLKGSNKFSGVVIPYISLIEGKVTIESNTDVFYSVDGTDPDNSYNKYTEPFSPANSCVIKAVSCVGNVLSAVTKYFYSADNLEKIIFADSAKGNKTLEDLCLSLYDTNKDGILQMSEVRAVLSIAGNAGFKTCQMDTFNELVEFENATIADSAFAGNTYIKEVTLPKNLKTLTSRAFSGCTSLQSVVMFDKVEEIQIDCFKGCSSLTKVVFSDNIKKIGSNAFMNAVITGLPDNLIELGDYSFAYSTKISELPNTLQIIGNSAFERAPITIQSIPDNVYKIGSRAFYQCTSMNISKLPKNLIEIGDSAFSGCKESVTVSELPLGLTSIPNNCFWDTKISIKEIPASVKSIGSGAFYGSNIQKIKILSEELVTHGNTNAFPSTATFYVPDNLVESYKSAANWANFSSKIFALSTDKD